MLYSAPALGKSETESLLIPAAVAGTASSDAEISAKPAPKARPLRVVFLDMFNLSSWFAHNQLIAGCKR
jgi:hypothetical protein